MGIFQDLFGTTADFFRVGLAGSRLKNNAGALQVRNATDSADAAIAVSQLNLGTTNALAVQRNAGQGAALTVIFPPAKATDGQVLAQRSGTASGVIELELIDAGNTASSNKLDTTSLAFGAASPVTMFNMAAGNVITIVDVIVDTPFNGTPSISVGITGTTSKYVASTQVDLTAVASTIFRVNPGLPAPVATEALIVTYTGGGASAGAARILVYFGVPT